MNARLLVLAATLVLSVIACGATPPPATPAPPPAEPLPAGAPTPHRAEAPPACKRVWTGHEAIPPEFLTCTTTADCTVASSGGCCPGSVAVNKAHAACMQAQELPCEVICEPTPPMSVQCVRNTCTMVPAK